MLSKPHHVFDRDFEWEGLADFAAKPANGLRLGVVSGRRFRSQVLGPHFEALCREFTLRRSRDLFGAAAGEVAAGTVADPANRRQIEVDVVALSPAWPGDRRRVLALGEAKWGDVMGMRHLERLRRARDLLHRKGYDTRGTALVCYSAAGFDAELRAVAEGVRGESVLLLGLERMYPG